jgi:hypothetical protein
MMARSTKRSNQRPDTLMQDRRRQFDEIFLQRAAGPYIRVKSAILTAGQPLPICPDQRTFSAPVGMSQTCQGTKSLRSSPLRGSKSREAGSRG